jgi:hypothetical protein
MSDSRAHASVLERHFWKFVGAPLAIAAVCVGCAALAMRRPETPGAPTLEPAKREPAPPLISRNSTPIAPIEPIAPIISPRELQPFEKFADPPKPESVTEPPAEVRVNPEPQKVSPPKAVARSDDRDLGFAKSESPDQSSRPMEPARRVAPDPFDAPYVVPPNKPYIGQNDPKPPQPSEPPKLAVTPKKRAQATAPTTGPQNRMSPRR